MPEKHKKKSEIRAPRVHGHNPHHVLKRSLLAAVPTYSYSIIFDSYHHMISPWLINSIVDMPSMICQLLSN
jgi:hypothetical protein